MIELPAPIEHTLQSHDGFKLHIHAYAPKQPIASVVVGHALMVKRSTLVSSHRLSLIQILFSQGYQVIVPEMRGRGQSGPEPQRHTDWSYKTLVDDMGAFIDFAKELAPRLQVFIVGHSLGGHLAMAYLSMNPTACVDGVVLLGSVIWCPQFEKRKSRRLLKRLAVELIGLATLLFGYVPAKEFGFGNANESAGYWQSQLHWMRRGKWAYQQHDFGANMANIKCPILHIVSEADSWLGDFVSALHWTKPLDQRRTLIQLGPSCTNANLQGIQPKHMELVTSQRSAPIWKAIGDWIFSHIQKRG